MQFNIKYMFHSSIGRNFFLSLTGILLLAVPSFLLLFKEQSEDHFLDNLKTKANLINASIYMISENAIKNKNYTSLQDTVLKILRKIKGINNLIIFTPKRVVLASSNPEKFPLFSSLDYYKYKKIIDGNTQNRSLEFIFDREKNIAKSLKKFQFYFSSKKNRKPVKVKEINILYNYIEFSTKGIHNSLSNLWLYPALLAIFFLFFGFIVAYRLSFSLTNRIKILAKKVQQIASGNLDVSIKALSNDEFGGLALDVENMRLAIKDLTDNLEKKVKERTLQLEEANKELEAFSYSISHDIKAPVRSIKGFTEAILEDYSNVIDEPGKGYLERILAATKRLGELINDILRLSRLSRSDLYIGEINLTDLCKSICKELKKQNPNSNVDIAIGEGIVSKGDPRFLRLAMENLFTNAWKYSAKEKNPHIGFGAIDTGKKTTYFIKDNGVGFDMSQAYKLFIPFQRLHSNDQFEGTGIGLAIVQRIIHRHGGRIWAKSEPRKGAVFYFTL